MNPVLRIGLTGGIGSGKSTTCTTFEELGVPVIDADRIAHQLVGRQGAAFSAVRATFGDRILMDNGEIDRHYLRELVFSDHQARKKLEAILHPLIYQEIAKQVAEVQHPFCIISIPLLTETGAANRVDRVLVIDAPEAVQLKRAVRRDGGMEETIVKIMNSQATREQRLAVADDILHNDADIESLKEQIYQLHKKYILIATSQHDSQAESGLK